MDKSHKNAHSGIKCNAGSSQIKQNGEAKLNFSIFNKRAQYSISLPHTPKYLQNMHNLEILNAQKTLHAKRKHEK